MAGQGAGENEEQPLLSNKAAADGNLPNLQILILCAAAAIEPLAAASPGPFLPALLLSTHITDVADLGRYSGILNGCFALAECTMLVAWGRISDRYGRRPALITTMISSAIFIGLFGFCKTYTQLVLCRLIAGFFNGNATLIQTTLAEISTADPATAFSSGNSESRGMMLGPMVGGLLVDPEKNLPRVCIATLSVCTTIGLYFLLDEPKRKVSLAQERPTIREAIKRPGVSVMLIMTGLNMILGGTFGNLVPLYAFTPPSLGGLGFSPSQIAIFVSLGGLSQACWLLFALPPFDRRFGHRKVLRTCLVCWPSVFVLFTLANWQARLDHLAGIWACLLPLALLGQGVAMAFTETQLLLNAFAGPVYLSTCNGLALTISAVLRTVIPVVTSTTFAASHHFLYGQLVWISAIGVVYLSLYVSRWIPRNVEADKLDSWNGI